MAKWLEIPTAGKTVLQVAEAVGDKGLSMFGQQEGELAYVKRATKKRQELWRKLGLTPRGIDREVVVDYAPHLHGRGSGPRQHI